MSIKARVARLERDSPTPDSEELRQSKEWWAAVYGFWQDALADYPEALAAVRRNLDINEPCTWSSPAAQNGELDKCEWSLVGSFWAAVRDFPEAHRRALLATEALERYWAGECEREGFGTLLEQLGRQHAGLSARELEDLHWQRQDAREKEQPEGEVS
jgi:hypothetical protein